MWFYVVLLLVLNKFYVVSVGCKVVLWCSIWKTIQVLTYSVPEDVLCSICSPKTRRKRCMKSGPKAPKQIKSCDTFPASKHPSIQQDVKKCQKCLSVAFFQHSNFHKHCSIDQKYYICHGVQKMLKNQ